MKATQRDFPGIATKAARQCSVFFFCGPDEAGASAAAEAVCGALADPGERIELSGADLKRDPVALGDEARSSSLFGDARHIFVRANGDEAHDALANLFAGEGDACPVLVVASAATDKSRTAKLLARREDALVAMLYPPDLRSMTATVRDLADTAGVRLGGDLAERIARAATLDQRLARSEIEKLALYLDAAPATPKQADAQDWHAIGAKTEEDGFMPIVNAALGGHAKRLPGELQRMRELSINSVAIALAVERRTAQLAQLAGRLGRSGDVDGFIQSEKQARRIFWKDERDLREQLRIWRGARLDRLVERVTALHRSLLANSQSGELLLAQELTTIARAAAAAGAR
ncbi:DNA polymerase III subunit delta [Erythrobacter litoralis]|uniref:DNA polymerase III delta subunit n=1 Tax=Erythrobacter litoralis (strain HTCC2594) TaxID=314225 RepID=Q2N6Z7_ERYLH|nr:DNA polymerase III subunit delta [Erythrobacter litoralis]ABC64544.1 DNA polymerase III delta subunit [Erythrobacter litoralis HTCC2594]